MYREVFVMKHFSRQYIPIAAIALAIVFLYTGSFFIFEELVNKQIQAFSSQEQTVKSRHYGYIQPQVVDGVTEEPIEGAVIVIPETGQQFVTSKDGQTAIIKVPIKEDLHFSEIALKP